MAKPDVEPIVVSIATFSALTNLGKTTAYNLIRQNRLTRVRVLGRTLITMESIKALLAESGEEAK